MPPTSPLNPSPPAAQAGFRLHRLEVYNWGTFDKRVWTLSPNGDNALLTGDIGSGKSTLVDAVTTLLVPAQRIAYNKAAGAEARERTLRSYVLGHFKSERADSGLAAKPVALRDYNAYSVILGMFRHVGFDQNVTLAQVFWFKEAQGQPARFFVLAEKDLSIAQDFAGFGSDISDLRKRLRARKGITLYDSFPPYGAWFRRRFGIENEQALALFHQTVSMKSVGNLTDFVREHMLEAFDVAQRIDALIQHFDDLNRAHVAVLKAKDQVKYLQPLVADCSKHAELSAQADELRAAREALKPWFAGLKAELLTKHLFALEIEYRRSAARIVVLDETRRGQGAERDQLKRDIAENGGNRLAWIGTEIDAKTAEKNRRFQRAERYAELANELGLLPVTGPERFVSNGGVCQTLTRKLREKEAAQQNRQTEAHVELHRLKSDLGLLEKELTGLRARRSNIDEAQVIIRRTLCAALGLDAAQLPFAGELIQVRREESPWEGAVERLLHHFGLSLLVPDSCYPAVAQWVNQNSLKGRLVYYRVHEPIASLADSSSVDALTRKLSIKPDSPFYAWMERELLSRFNYVCCEKLEDFQRQEKAVTRAGQIKSGGERHEKDDRYRIDDRSRYVLGWSNEGKIAVLEKRVRSLSVEKQGIEGMISEILSDLKRNQDQIICLVQMGEFRDFQELDWQPLVAEVANLDRERKVLAAASDLLQTLTVQLTALDASLAQIERELHTRNQDQARSEEKQAQVRIQLEACRANLALLDEDTRALRFPQLLALRAESSDTQNLTLESCDNRERDMGKWLQTKIEGKEKEIQKTRDRIIDAMRRYKITYQVETEAVDVSIEAGHEYVAMLEQLQADDLPRFEARFKELLNENTIREVANFQSQLGRERKTIKERIERINQSLRQIDYNPGRYIELEAQPSPDPEIRDFQSELRACLDDTMTGSEDAQYSEAKFLQVKAIIERFRGRDGRSDADRRWTRKVTDVRNGFVFAAAERWREDDKEYEHYTDSGGKSGGQKEKLAYTVLAASLAYQFGLESDLKAGAANSRTFRFVVIDEAFGRGSDESARFGLELFKRLNLQLLIVTPLQKIHIIEPFVASVGFVHNEAGRESLLRNLSIAEYQAEKNKSIEKWVLARAEA